MNIEWDASGYQSDFGYVTGFGVSAMELIDAPLGSSLIDLGCGTGTLTALLAERGYAATGIDASPEMLGLARAAYPDIPFIEADACDFKLDEPVDVVFSNSLFHWIEADRQAQMFSSMAAALKPRGQLVFECGGRGCIASIHEALADAFDAAGLSYRMPFHYLDADECTELMTAAGLETTHVIRYEPRPVIAREDGIEAYVRMFLKSPFDGLDAETTTRIIGDASRRLKASAIYHDGQWTPDYVRLRMRALKR